MDGVTGWREEQTRPNPGYVARLREFPVRHAHGRLTELLASSARRPDVSVEPERVKLAVRLSELTSVIFQNYLGEPAPLSVV